MLSSYLHFRHSFAGPSVCSTDYFTRQLACLRPTRSGRCWGHPRIDAILAQDLCRSRSSANCRPCGQPPSTPKLPDPAPSKMLCQGAGATRIVASVHRFSKSHFRRRVIGLPHGRLRPSGHAPSRSQAGWPRKSERRPASVLSTIDSTL
jgi:hypothetical protein